MILLVIVQIVAPMRLDHFVAMFPQYLSMYLVFCVFANLLSIYAPLYIAAGSLKASNPKLKTVLLQLLMFMVLLPLTMAATLLPLGTEMLLRVLDWAAGVPICLVLSLLECAVIFFLYRLSLGWQGSLLQAREQRILETVTNRAP
jgi:hypothetical protein